MISKQVKKLLREQIELKREIQKYEMLLNESSLVIGTKDGKYLTIQGDSLKFTDNVNMASVFDSLDEIDEFEDEYGYMYDEFTYPYIVDGDEITKAI